MMVAVTSSVSARSSKSRPICPGLIASGGSNSTAIGRDPKSGSRSSASLCDRYWIDVYCRSRPSRHHNEPTPASAAAKPANISARNAGVRSKE
jgi:hypothetical protein